MVINRLEGDRRIELHGGFFSVKLEDNKQRWLPCEGEALAIRLTLEHFSKLFRVSQNKVTHFTDSLPCVLAWRKKLNGAYSTNSRISTFLSDMSKFNVELIHKPGQEMFSTDHASRNISTCPQADKCQICQFSAEWQNIGELSADIRNVSIADIVSGKSTMPLIQKSTWLQVQLKDQTCQKLTKLITTSQLPEKKKTNGQNTVLKLLHNMYCKGKLKIDSSGLILVTSQSGYFSGQSILVPDNLYPAIVSVLHQKLAHPSKAQLSKLLSRYFYSVGRCTYYMSHLRHVPLIRYPTNDIPHLNISHLDIS